MNEAELLCSSEETAMDQAVERLTAAAEMLERAVATIAQRGEALSMEAEASVERIVATVEGRRELELAQRLAAAEAELVELRAKTAEVRPLLERGRKTLPSGMVNLLAKQGVAIEGLEPGAIDAALVSLSVEQRIAVKAQLMRAGLLG